MVGWHHGLNGYEYDQTQGNSEGQGSLMCCSPWGHKESDTTAVQVSWKPALQPLPCNELCPDFLGLILFICKTG